MEGQRSRRRARFKRGRTGTGCRQINVRKDEDMWEGIEAETVRGKKKKGKMRTGRGERTGNVKEEIEIRIKKERRIERETRVCNNP